MDMARRGDDNVRQICSRALNQIPPEMVALDDKMIKVLVSLLQAPGVLLDADTAATVSEPSLHDLRPWTPRRALSTGGWVDLQPCWINEICPELQVSAAGGSRGRDSQECHCVDLIHRPESVHDLNRRSCESDSTRSAPHRDDSGDNTRDDSQAG